MLSFLSCLFPTLDNAFLTPTSKSRDLFIPVPSMDESQVASFGESSSSIKQGAVNDSPIPAVVALPKSPRSPKSTLEIILEDLVLEDVVSPTKQLTCSFNEVATTAAVDPLSAVTVTLPKSPRYPQSTIPIMKVILEDEVILFSSHLLMPDLNSNPSKDVTIIDPFPRALPTSASKDAVTNPRSSDKLLPKIQAGGVFGFRPEQRQGQRYSVPNHADDTLVVNKDVELENLAEGGDIDGL
jgi:hypothetical protein